MSRRRRGKHRAPRPLPLWLDAVPAVLALIAAAAVTVACACIRDLPGGARLARDGMHALSGSGRTFEMIARCVGWVPRGAGLVLALVLLAVWFRQFRRGACAGVIVLVGSNVSAQVSKSVLVRLLEPAAATLPSGHATLALSSAVALVLITPPRRRTTMMAIAGAWGCLGCLGVIAAYWHALGDVVSAMSIVAAWLLVAHVLVSWGGPGDAAPSENFRPRRHHVVAAGCGAAWAVVTALGWGTGINALGAWWVAAAMAELVLVPAAVAWIVAAAARAVPDSAGPTH